MFCVLLSGLFVKKLYYYEMESNVKMSDLTEEAVAPKSIERQKVSTCLKVFSERTYHAIMNHSRLDSSKKTLLFFCKLSTTGEQYLMSNREIVPLQKSIVCAQKLEAQMTPAWRHDVQHGGSSGKANKAVHEKHRHS